MTSRDILKDVLGIGLVLFALFLIISLFTFHTGDIAFLSAPVHAETWNAGGRIGASLAFGLLYAVGTLATWSLAFLIGGWGVSVPLGKRWPDLPYKITGGLLFLGALSIAEALVMDGVSSSLPHGGVLGLFLTRTVFLPYLGETGTYLAVLYVALVSFFLATDFLFLQSALDAIGRIRSGDTWVQKLKHKAVLYRRHRSERRLGEQMDRARRLREHRLRRERRLVLMDEEAGEQALASWPAGAGLPQEDEVRTLLADPPETRPAGLPPKAEAEEEEAAWEAEEGRKEAAASSEERQEEKAEEDAGGQEDAEEEASAEDEEEAAEVNRGKARRKARPAKRTPAPEAGESGYAPPSPDILDEPEPPSAEEDAVNEVRSRVLEDTLAHFKIRARVVGAVRGPSITQFEIELAPGTKSSQLASLQNDLALAMKVEKVRIVAPLPGRGTIGVEVPNAFRETVTMREIVETPAYQEGKKDGIPLFLGKDAGGAPVLGNLAEMPHLLIAGSTGSGKSICLNSVLAGILLTQAPERVKLVLIDPKRVEMTPFREIPHLLGPVLTEAKKAAQVLEGLCGLMDKRYELFEQLRIRQISSYNRMKKEDVVSKLSAGGLDPDRVEYPMPYIIVVVDELSDLMLVSSREVENAIIRLAQKSRAVGIHLVLSTQRPSSDVITGQIKANMPARVAFKVTSMVESRVILDQNGAEKLLGAGDMLYKPPKVSHLVRAQGTYVSDEEVGRLVDWAQEQEKPRFEEEASPLPAAGDGGLDGEDEKLFEAGDVILATGRASTTLLQRRLSIGYTRAARLVDLLEKAGLVGPFKGSKSRELLMTFEEWEAYKERQGQETAAAA